MEFVPRGEPVNQLITGRHCSVWGSKPSNTSRIWGNKDWLFSTTMRQRTLLCRWSNIWPLKTCPSNPTPLNRPILTLVIYSGFRKWNHSYMGVVSRVCTKFGAIADWCTRDSKKPVPGMLPSSGRNDGPLEQTRTGPTPNKQNKQKINDKGTCIFRYRLSPGNFAYAHVCMKSSRT